MKVADLEAELREFTSKCEALKLAMRVLEEENQQFRNVLTSASQAIRQAKTLPANRLTSSPNRSHSRNSSKSSLSIPDAAGSAPGSPHANLQYLTPVGHLPSVGNETHPAKTPITVDLAGREETAQSQPVTWSAPPPLEVDCWPDSPSTPYYPSSPPETADPGEGETTARLATE
jgi:hypothetical protein